MKKALLITALTIAAYAARAEVAWVWDTEDRPADVVQETDAVTGTFEAVTPAPTAKTGLTSAFGFFTAFFAGAEWSEAVPVDGTKVRGFMILFR